MVTEIVFNSSLSKKKKVVKKKLKKFLSCDIYNCELGIKVMVGETRNGLALHEH